MATTAKKPSWRLATSLAVLRRQVDLMAPNRSKKSDGSRGDSAHAARKSDHNEDARGIVHAIDITHDPDNGCDAGALAEALRISRDKRISYVIWNRRIFSAQGGTGRAAWKWRKYTGTNPHDKHVHVSVTARGEDDPREWQIGEGA